MNRPRLTEETFEEYRANQRTEQAELNRFKKGRMFWRAPKKGKGVGAQSSTYRRGMER